MKRRLVLITEIIAPYRIPVFNALAERPEVDLTVLFLTETDPSLREWLVYKDEIRFPYQVLPSWRRRVGAFNLLLNRGLSAALDRWRPEMVICGGYNYIASWEALWWSKSHRVPFVLWSESNARDIRSEHSAIEFLKKQFLAACDGFVVPGKSSEEYLRLLGGGSRPIVVAPNAVDIEFFAGGARRARAQSSEVRRKRGLPERYFLYVGRLVPQKGVFELVEAYAKLDANLRQSISLVFAGDGVARDKVLKFAAALAPGQVRLVGFKQREELPELYALADAVILPTHSDPWGLVVNEAMACGKPVIVSSAAGCVEDLVRDGGNGYVVPAKDVASLAKAMSSLASDEELRKRMSRLSFEMIQAYSPDAWAQGIRKCFL